ncbi:DNA repair protein RadA [Rickettsiales bacterium Ac37b]|nr:DNA repair protein RadA [Rickettsiales bacterium Ac37b]
MMLSKNINKTSLQFVCNECGAIAKKWIGKCIDCGAWNSLVEEVAPARNTKTANIAPNALLLNSLSSKEDIEVSKIKSKIVELDRVLGGGIVRGSTILIGGEPGIGKSTLLLQLAAQLSLEGTKSIYISGEESVEQIRLRAKRLELANSPLHVLSATNATEIVHTLNKLDNIELVIIDSIQTMYIEEFTSNPGTVSQIRSTAHEFITLAKKLDIVIVFVGHITKEGSLAGPKVLEHMVDVVLYFEGDQGHNFRIIRATKNRFGGVKEIGIFEMAEVGLIEVTNPSSLFLSNMDGNISGSSVLAAIEGTRALMVEVQALISSSTMVMPRRAVVGWDINRMAMLIAVLQVRYGLNLSDKEVYLNIVGGLKILEPAADLAIAATLISAATNIILPEKTIIFGEIGLGGEVRNVSYPDIRLKEAIKLGFKNVIMPKGTKINQNFKQEINIYDITHVKQLKSLFSSNFKSQ